MPTFAAREEIFAGRLVAAFRDRETTNEPRFANHPPQPAAVRPCSTLFRSRPGHRVSEGRSRARRMPGKGIRRAISQGPRNQVDVRNREPFDSLRFRISERSERARAAGSGLRSLRVKLADHFGTSRTPCVPIFETRGFSLLAVPSPPSHGGSTFSGSPQPTSGNERGP